MPQLHIGQFRVDTKRCELVNESQIITLQPKVLQVLLMLCEKPGEVVSHDEILDKVWPDVVIEPNTLQRCIAQLRKAFGDDAKKQVAIKTHPKKGYSLILDVSQHIPDSEGKVENSPRTLSIIVASFVVVLFCFYWFQSHWSQDPTQLNVRQILPLTATDNREFGARVSPDGKQVAFLREQGGCNRHIVVKSLETQAETVLTQEPGKYDLLRWGLGSSYLASTKESACVHQQKFEKCREVFRFDLKADSNPDKLLACGHDSVEDMAWLPNQQLAFIAQDDDGQTTLKKLNTKTGEVELVLTKGDQQAYSLSYSDKRNQLAVMTYDQASNNRLLLLDENLEVKENVNVTSNRPEQDSARRDIDWHSSGRFLISSAGKNLLTIDLSGQLTFHPLATLHNIKSPSMAHHGDIISATISVLDWDLQQGAIEEETNTSNASQVLFQSNAEEFNAVYQRSGDILAFYSERDGSEQVYLGNIATNEARKLSSFPSGSDVGEMSWQHDDLAVFVVVNQKLVRLSTDGSVEQFNTEFYVDALFQTLIDGRLLLKIHYKGLPYLAIWAPRRQTEFVYQGDFFWAQSGSLESKSVFIRGYDKQLYQLSDNNLVRLDSPLKNIDNRFVIKENTLYATSDGLLWSVDLNSGHSKNYPHLGVINKLKDIHKGNVLFAQWVSEQNEIAILKP